MKKDRIVSFKLLPNLKNALNLGRYLFGLILIIVSGCTSNNNVLERCNKFIKILDVDTQNLNTINAILFRNTEVIFRKMDKWHYETSFKRDQFYKMPFDIPKVLSGADSVVYSKSYNAIWNSTNDFSKKKYNMFSINYRPSDSSIIYEMSTNVCKDTNPKMIVYHRLTFRTNPNKSINPIEYIDKEKGQFLAKEKPLSLNWSYSIINEPYNGR